jgi:hypothetical protein
MRRHDLPRIGRRTDFAGGATVFAPCTLSGGHRSVCGRLVSAGDPAEFAGRRRRRSPDPLTEADQGVAGAAPERGPFGPAAAGTERGLGLPGALRLPDQELVLGADGHRDDGGIEHHGGRLLDVVDPALSSRRCAGLTGLRPSWRTAVGRASCDRRISGGGRGLRQSDET